MNPEEQRIAIAQACGWKLKSDELGPMWSWQNEFLTHRIKWVTHKEMASQGVLPDYLNDLNAMHKAEESLHGNQYVEYTNLLIEIEGSLFGIRATAAERAEAFLHTIGKWVSE
jgi:hypothetical protein